MALARVCSEGLRWATAGLRRELVISLGDCDRTANERADFTLLDCHRKIQLEVPELGMLVGILAIGTEFDESLKPIYRNWGIACAGQQVYAPRYRAERLVKIAEAWVCRRAEIYYRQFDVLAALHYEARRELLAEARKHRAMRLLPQIFSIGPIGAALLIALMQTPHRFGTKRQLWAHCGLALRTYDSGE